MILALSCGVTAYEFYHTHDYQLLFEPAGVMLAILLSTGIGFIFETKADKEFDILNQVKDDRLVKVVRRKNDNSRPRLVTIKKSDVVVGDIVRLEGGDEVPQAYATVVEELEALELRNMLGEEGDNLGAPLCSPYSLLFFRYWHSSECRTAGCLSHSLQEDSSPDLPDLWE